MEPEGANPAPVPIDEDALKGISGGQMMNSTEIVYASTYVPFDSSF
ncbi:MAG: hypothetical protein V9E85_13860 [Candidatus Nanopelagicales bacterium]|jgi:hypothetical protein